MGAVCCGAWVRILVVLDSETNLSDLPVPVHSLVGLTLLPTSNPLRSQSQVFHMRAGIYCSVGNSAHHTAELTTSIFLCGLVSSVGMAAAFSARRWVPYAGRAWVRILVVLDSEGNLSDLPVPMHS